MFPIEFIESKNVFYEENVKQQYFQQDDHSGSIIYGRNDPTAPILNINFILSANKRVITRKYQTFTEVMSQLGGLISISRFFGSLFLSIFPYLSMRSIFFKKLYWIPQNKIIDKGISKIEEVENEKKFENSVLSMIPKIPLSSYLQRDQENESSRNENFKCKYNHPEVIELNEVQDKKSGRKNSHLLQCVENLKMRIRKNKMGKKLNFSFYTYFKNKFKSFCKMKLDFEGQIVLSADKMYEKETDIIQLLKRIQDIEKLKCILLNEKQRTIFDLIRPKINNVFHKEIDCASRGNSFDLSEIIMKSLCIGKNQNKEEINKVVSYYEEKLRSDEEEHITEIDRNLLNFFKE